MLSIALRIRLPWWWRPYARAVIFATWLAVMVGLPIKIGRIAEHIKGTIVRHIRVTLASLALIAVTGTALAEPPPGADTNLAPWFHSLRVPDAVPTSGGLTCCTPADYA